MSESSEFSPPPAFMDLALILLGLFILMLAVSLTNMRQEYQTRVDLLVKRTPGQSIGAGPDVLSLAIIKKDKDQYLLVLESKKLGVKEFKDVATTLDELQRLAPPELVLRVDQEAPFAIPQQIMVFAHQHHINLGFSYQSEG